MWNTLWLLLLLISLQLVVTFNHFGQRVKCADGQYNYRGLGLCFNCTQCAEFHYEQEKCTKTRNTVCGWCGKEPNFDEISDTVLASYQTKCMMSRLEFVDMKKLQEELRDEGIDSEEDEVKELPRLTLRKSEPSAKDLASLQEDPNALLRQLTLSFGDHDQEDMQTSVRKSFIESLFSPMDRPKKAKNEDLPDPSDRVTDDSVSKEDEDAEESTEEDIDQTVSDTVNAYMITKGKKIGDKKNKGDKSKVGHGSVTILSRDEVEASLKQLVELTPAQKRVYSSSEEYDSSESSNERAIKWDKWLDDNIKPIRNGVHTEIVDMSQFGSSEEVEKDEENEPPRSQPDVFASPKAGMTPNEFVHAVFAIVSVIFGIVVIMTLGTVALVQMRQERKRKRFTGVPTDSQDYHMIVDASNFIEELEKREKKSARHVHDNPVFDI